MPVRELMGTSVEIGAPDFEIREPAIDVALPGDAHVRADRHRAILTIGGVGTFAVAGGSRIRFDPQPGVAPAAVSTWLHGSVAALLLAQRGLFALHASTVDIGGVGVAVAGPRGAGKSTTALRLEQMGHPLVTDDVSPLDPAGPMTVEPFSRPVHVFAHTADSLGIDVAGAEPLLPAHPKLALPTAARAPVPLAAIAVLRVAEDETESSVEAQRIRGASARWLVDLNTYRTELLGDIYRAEMFAWAARVADRAAVYSVTRPASGWTADEVAGALVQLASEVAS